MAKILIVDDEKGTVEVVKNILIGQNYEVVTAYDGKEGIEKIQSENPDLIILDVHMPSMNGYELIRFLRNESVNANKPMIPIIVLTVKEKMEEMLKLEGVEGCLIKPIAPSYLLAKVEVLLKKSSSVSEKK